MKNSNNKIIAVIPARYGSMRLPGKPLIILAGKTMIQRVYEQAKKSKYINNIIIATDDERIEKAVKKFGGEVVITPAEIASGSDRIAHVVKNLKNVDIVVNIQGDEPLINPEMIDQTIAPLLNDNEVQVSTAVKVIENIEDLSNPNIPKVVIDSNNFAIYFSRSPIPYYRDSGNEMNWLKNHPYYKHIGLYVYRREFLLRYSAWKNSPLEMAEKLEQLRIIENGSKIKTVITKFDSISVDTPDDVKKIEKIIQQFESVINE